MSGNPLVSVIIPTYNRYNFIGDAIRSVLSQTYKNIEIIVVDDGSKDNTYKIIKELSNCGMRYIYQSHLGVSEARNRGAYAALGEYLAFLDSDDLWLESKIEKQIRIILKEQDVGLVFTNCYNWNMDNNTYTLRYKKIYNSKEIMGKILFRKCYLIPSTILLKRELFFKVGGFDTNLRRSEDRDFSLRISKETKIVGLKEPLSIIRLHTKYNNPKDPSDLFDYSKTVESEIYMLKKLLHNEKKLFLKNRIWSRYYFVWGYQYRSLKNYKDAFRMYVKSILYNPLNIRTWINFFFIKL